MLSLHIFRIFAIPHLCGPANKKVFFVAILIFDGESELVPQRIPCL